MKSGSYTPAIPLDELMALARTYGPPGLVKGNDSPASSADEFLRLARQFHRQRNENNPEGYRPWTDRWENEGGTVFNRESNDNY